MKPAALRALKDLLPGDPVGSAGTDPAYAYLTLIRYALLGAAEQDRYLDGLADTPARAALALEELTCGYQVDVPGLFTTFEADGYDEMVCVRDIAFASLCEHHLLPFVGKAHVAYLPNGRIVGLSKLARLVEAYARRFQVQERMTAQVADALMNHLGALGVAVIVEAEHLCMTMRGVRKPGATTRTSVMRGAMLDKPEARAEALALIGA